MPTATRQAVGSSDPATGAPLCELPNASVEDGLRALDAAADAQQSWAETPARERAELLRRAFEATIARARSRALLFSFRVAACPLRCEQDTADDKGRDDQRGADTAQVEAAVRHGFGEQVAHGRAERTS